MNGIGTLSSALRLRTLKLSAAPDTPAPSSQGLPTCITAAKLASPAGASVVEHMPGRQPRNRRQQTIA